MTSPMRRLLGLFVMIGLLLGQSSALAFSNCEHRSLEAHNAARHSHDRHIAGAAAREETAAAVAAKKGAAASASAGNLLTAALPTGHPLPLMPSAAIRFERPRDADRLDGRTVFPLLRPPLG